MSKIILPSEISAIFARPRVVIPKSREHMLDLVFDHGDGDTMDVSYAVPGNGEVVEAQLVRCKNGVSVNYPDVYMRRRDPECMVVADDGDTDKIRYRDRYGEDFGPLRNDTLAWLGDQDSLIVLPFMAGGRNDFGYPSLLVAPANAGFFVTALADLQSFIPEDEVPENFVPKAIIYVAPPFRHTHFSGKQVVVHNRLPELHEIYSYNLYPGPSAKKGVYSFLLNIGESEGWVTLHSSSVKVITPYENEFVIMHEGASGGGKSEMIQQLHRLPDGKILLGENLVTGEIVKMDLSDTSELHPVTDDMALCHTRLQAGNPKLVIMDAESGWFLRVDHLTHYGTEPGLEKLTVHPPEPLIFLNLDAREGATCLVWEHTMDSPGKPCPNPRVVMPRRFVPDTINEPIEVDVRSFGVRTPPTTKENPNYGIIGIFHILPRALAWLWRLVAPRGYANPSIIGGDKLASEGVGSYWPFATGKAVTQANLLLEQILSTPDTRYELIPNQHIGAYKVGFMPQWIAREYLARRGSSHFKSDQLIPARCTLLGYTPRDIKMDGKYISRGFLRVNEQQEVGEAGYDSGARILINFFKQELEKFLTDELHPVGRKIIEICMNDGSLENYHEVIRETTGQNETV
ncbi:MAG TPA: DUF4914 family protein [Spirochaetia bacterium]|nr:DUF4914 family protein [Spirochaetia bacterium]